MVVCSIIVQISPENCTFITIELIVVEQQTIFFVFYTQFFLIFSRARPWIFDQKKCTLKYIVKKWAEEQT